MQSSVCFFLRLLSFIRNSMWVAALIFMPASAQVTYNLGNTGFYDVFSSGGGIYSGAGGTELGMWARNTGSKQIVTWRKFKTAGDNTGNDRNLQPGDIVTITVSATSATGCMGLSLNAGPSTGSWGNRHSNTRLYIQCDDVTSSWYVNHSGGNSPLNYNVGTVRRDYQFRIHILSETNCNVELWVNGTFHYRENNLTMNGAAGANISHFVLYLEDDWNGASNQDINWKQVFTHNASGNVNLGYFLGSGTFTPGKVTDGLQNTSNSLTLVNTVNIGGNQGTAVILSQNNSYSGVTTINTDATLRLNSAGSPPDGPLGSAAAGTVVNAGGVLDLYGINLANNEALTLNGLGISTGGALVNSSTSGAAWNGAVSLATSSRITAGSGNIALGGSITGGSNVLFVGGSQNTTISGDISGTGALNNGTTTSLYKDGTGILTLSGNNTYTGDTRIAAGNLTVGSGGTLGVGSDIFISNNASLTVNTNVTVGSLQETSTTDFGTASIGAGVTLTINGANKGINYQSTISGSGNLTMNGSGSTLLALFNSQTYTGTTTVSGGTIGTSGAMSCLNYVITGGKLEFYNDNLVNDNADFTISGGTLDFQGTDVVDNIIMTGGTLTVAAGKTLTINGKLSINAASALNINGTLAFGSNGTLEFTSGLTTYEACWPTVNGPKNLIINCTSSTATVKLHAGRTINGDLILTSGIFDLWNKTFTYGGSSITRNLGTIDATTANLVFTNTVHVSVPANVFVNADVSTLTMNGSGGITLRSNLFVDDLLELNNGIISLGSSMLEHDQLSNVTGGSTSSYVRTNGSGVYKSSISNGSNFTFHVGRSSYNQLYIKNNNGTGVDVFTVIVYDSAWRGGLTGALFNKDLVFRTWDITKSNPNIGGGVDMKFMYRASEIIGTLNPPTLNHFNTVINAWEIALGTGSVAGSAPFILTQTGYTGSFSPFVIGGDAAAPLPLTWQSFACNNTSNGKVELQWSTAMEQNTAAFEVETSTGNEPFKKIGYVAAAGYSQISRHYRFEDTAPAWGISYYRIKQTDRDGKFSYSEICKVENEMRATPVIFPNPCDDLLELNGMGNMKNISFQIYSSVGTEVDRGNLTHLGEKLDVKNLPPGIYSLKLSAAGREWNLLFAIAR
jgi:autotransporter-associated beta strand protein